MDLEIQGLRVMISAGAAGIGLEIARAFVREGARAHVCDVDRDALARLRTTDPKITTSVCDVASRVEVARFFEEGIAALGGLDCLVNNAGIAGPTGRIEEIDPADWDRCIAIDLTGQFNCLRLAIPHLREGLLLHLRGVTLEITEACSGLRFLLAMIIVGAAFAGAVLRRWRTRAVVVALALAVGLVANLIRVGATAVLADTWGAPAAEGLYHQATGKIVYLVMLASFVAAVVRLRRHERARASA